MRRGAQLAAPEEPALQQIHALQANPSHANRPLTVLRRLLKPSCYLLKDCVREDFHTTAQS